MLKPPFLLSVGVEPNLAVRVGWMEGAEKRGRAWVEKVLSGDEVGGRCVVRRVRTEEAADSAMAGDEGVVAEEGRPCLEKVGEGYGVLHFGTAEVPTDVDGEAPLGGMVEESFLEGSAMINGKFGVALEEGWKAVEGARRRRGRGRRGVHGRS